MSSNAPKAERIDALTGLRFFCDAQCRSRPLRGIDPLPQLDIPLHNARSKGCNAFFILSGFILYYNYRRWFDGQVPYDRFWSFARARFARVYPMHFVALILITPVMIYLLRTHASAFETPSAFGIYFTPNTVRISWLANLTLLQPFIPLIWVQDLWNAPSWSIGNEFFFYALFPFFIAYVVSHLRTTRRLLLSVVGCLVAQAVLTITFIWLIVNVPLNPNVYMFTFLVVRNPLVRMWEFLFGCILGALFQHYQSSSSMQPVFGALRSRSGRNALLVIGIIGLMGLSVHTELTWTRASLLYYTLISALSLPMFGIIVLVLALRRTFLSSVFENRFIVMLGEASYSFYIIHWIPFYILVSLRLFGITAPGWWAPASVLATILASLVTWKFIEMPARRYLRTFLAPRPRQVEMRPGV